MKNLALAYLRSAKETRADFEGICVNLMGEVAAYAQKLGLSTRILWIESPRGFIVPPDGWPLWKHHCVPVIDGLVHDAWFPRLVLPPDNYARKAFAGQTVKLEYITEEELDCPAK